MKDWIGISLDLLDEVEQLVNAADRSDANRTIVDNLLGEGEFDTAFELLVAEAARRDVHVPARLLDEIEAEVVDADEDAFTAEFGEDLRKLRLTAV
ncbi:hypothetical protein P9209_22540 [Prescottella defluvii]|nr:hypothetical protein P9209_22540 [Prescottella defluvii]